MMRHHVSSAVRQRILKELSVRLQKTVVDVLSSRSVQLSLGIEYTNSDGRQEKSKHDWSRYSDWR